MLTTTKQMVGTLDGLLNQPSAVFRRTSFAQVDTYQAPPADPVALHKYLYTGADPVNNSDPTGKFSLGECTVAGAIVGGLVGMTYGGYLGAMKSGRLLSWETLEYAAAGLITGACIGAAAGAAVYGVATGLAALSGSGGLTAGPLFDLVLKAHGSRLPVFGAGVVVGLVLGVTDAPAATAALTGFGSANDATVFALGSIAGKNWERYPHLRSYFRWVIGGTGLTAYQVVRSTAFYGTWFLAGMTVGFTTSKAITWTTDQLVSYLNSAELAYGPGMEQEMAGGGAALPPA